MSGRSLHRLLEVCQEALARPAGERAAFLNETCAGDTELRRAVEALLVEQSAPGGFLDTPAWKPDRSPLAAGTRLGPYEIQRLIGAGGMGQVYEARDTRLGRTVAIKVLPPDLAADPVRRQRFEQEARAVSALNHPHICTLHDVGEADGSTFLVMEHLVGETLADRLAKGPLPLDQALTVATEMAEALAVAHKAGIVHRDLKPGNVMLTKTGAKLLDFGLAKLTGHGEQPAAAGLASAPTRSSLLTGAGMIVGTLQYMAPEQLEGKPADARTDLWALGAILYEMLTGTRAFEGRSAASVMGAILEREPAPVVTLQPLTPPALDRLVRQCLAKVPDDRWDSAHDVANQLQPLRESSGLGASVGLTPRRARVRPLTWAAIFGLAGALVGAGSLWLLQRARAPSVAVVRTSLDVRPAEGLRAESSYFNPVGPRTAFSWTPDGRALVFGGLRAGTQQLYVRELDRDEAHPLPGTEHAQAPAVSPDGQWVAFWAGAAVKKVRLAGGPVVEVASKIAWPPMGLAWDARGSLYFGGALDGRIRKVPAEGGLSAVTTCAEAEVAHVLPWPLPSGRTLLYTVRKRLLSWGDEEVVAQDLTTGKRTPLLKDAADARYVPTGHLVFLRRGQLFAVPFDAGRMEVRGTPVAVLDTVAQALTETDSTKMTGAGQFAIAPTGTLAWVRGPVVPYLDTVLLSVDRHGQVSALAAEPKDYGVVRLAPGGRQLAVSVMSVSELRLWTYDLVRGTPTPLARGEEAEWPIWAPNGQRLAFSWRKGGRSSLAWQRADGTTAPEVLVPGTLYPSSWTPDSRQLAVTTGDSGDLAVVTVEDGRATVQPLTQTPESEMRPEFSPDGRWLAYTSDVTGRDEVYVQPYPGPGPRVQVSLEGGSSPAWHGNGRELFFLSLYDAAGKARMMVAAFEPGRPPRIGAIRPLFELGPELYNLPTCAPIRCYDVTPDGQRFYAAQWRTPPPPPAVTHIDLVFNWFEELKAKVPPGR
jgi:Tol biopolymer transport system component